MEHDRTVPVLLLFNGLQYGSERIVRLRFCFLFFFFFLPVLPLLFTRLSRMGMMNHCGTPFFFLSRRYLQTPLVVRQCSNITVM